MSWVCWSACANLGRRRLRHLFLGLRLKDHRLPEAPDCRAGVLSTSLRNWELFMVGVVGWLRVVAHEQFLGDVEIRLYMPVV